MNTNIGHLFYKDYYADLNFIWEDNKRIAEFDGKLKNERLCRQRLTRFAAECTELYTLPLENESIELQTTYPGLLIGSGYRHEILSSEKNRNGDAYVQNEFKLGFHFDHTTGLPLIPGSSVKGSIRTAFEFATGYIVELLDEVCREDETWKVLSEAQKEKVVRDLEQLIFEHDGERNVYERDIFLDAFPVATGHPEQHFLANDYITPHDSPIKSPNLVQFLKVLPQVTFHFAFRLSDSTTSVDGHAVTFLRSHKINLFLAILKDFGVGAKTNVGYGQLEVDPQTEARMLAAQREEEDRRNRERDEADRLARELELEKREQQRILELERIQEEKRIQKEREERELKENGLVNLLAAQNNFHKGKDLIDRYLQIGEIETQIEAIQRFVRNVLSTLNSSQEKKKWNRKGKDNWRFVEQWIGKDNTNQLFEEFKNAKK